MKIDNKYFTNQYRLNKTELMTVLKNGVLKDALETYRKKIVEVCKRVNQEKKEYFYIRDRRLYVDTVNKIIIPNYEYYDSKEIDEECDKEEIERITNEQIIIEGMENSLLTELEFMKVKGIINPYIKDRGIVFEDNKSKTTYSFSRFTQRESGYDGGKKKIFPIVRYSKYLGDGVSLSELFVKYNLIPDQISDEDKQLFQDLCKLYAEKREYIAFTKGLVSLNVPSIIEDFFDLTKREMFCKLNFKFCTDKYTMGLEELIDMIDEKINVNGFTMEVDGKTALLECEKKRADIEPYEERILTDPNRGHWDLWGNEEGITATMESEYLARDPRQDINEEGVIAIDFGTKSTVVVYQRDIEHSLPMGIGEGNISKKINAKRYENPTIMQFVDLDKFLEAYNEREGRPSTEWEDLVISHTAMDKFDTSKSEEYYSFLHGIKQWAGHREKQFRIKPIKNDSIVLPAFLDLNEDEVNPIEIYAYYIGLYINNMRHGIYLDYYLSFPVTYDMPIREKILKSFEKGLKKSLPVPVLRDESIMSRFRVNGDISEPEAYAVCALQEYELNPIPGEEILYAIFDFGGGTTDFNFGLWRRSEKRRYDFTVENLFVDGDEYLGGENLLEMLAFEVFKQNQDMMREKGYTFTLAPKCREFAGSDALLSDSQEAEKNMHNLMEKLRPYWEKKKESGESENLTDNTIQVELYSKQGEYCVENFVIDTAWIDGFIEEKIREGVKRFFDSLMKVFFNEQTKKVEKINILLAGNSCKSPIVDEVFKKEIEENREEIRKAMGNKEMGDIFEVFPPLGTEAAYKKMDERNIEYEKDEYEKPTGKTGVAFGLIQCRKGGTIERISHIDEFYFQYYLGYMHRKKFEIFNYEGITKFKGKPDYNEWYNFIEADSEIFYIYYTTQPECLNGELMVEGNAGVKRIRCEIDEVNERESVFIRAVSPYEIEYTVSVDGKVSENAKIVRKELK